MKRRYWMLTALLIALVPLGLLSDAPAWGEWERSYYEKVLGYIPRGIAHAGGGGLLPDYSVPGLGEVGGYYLSALVGVALLAAIYYLLFRTVRRG
jgi:hypothetical protein